MATQVRVYPTYQSDIADALFPGDDYFAQERRSVLSEMLMHMVRVGTDMTLTNIGDRLSTFVPQRFAESTGLWKERDLKRWTEDIRPAIFKALGDYFIEGGFQDRIRVQQTLLDSLHANGIEIEGRNIIDAALPWAGSWTKQFILLAHVGRTHGVLFYGRPGLSFESIRDIMRVAGFTDEQIRTFFNALRFARKA